MRTQGEGLVLPQGSLPTKALEGNTLVIKGKDFDGFTQVVYPDGEVHSHQVANTQELLVKVANKLKGKYGIPAVNFVTLPKSLDADEQIVIEV